MPEDGIPHGPTFVEVRVAHDPEGRPAVLLQLEHGFVLLQPEEAQEVVLRLAGATVMVKRMQQTEHNHTDKRMRRKGDCPACDLAREEHWKEQAR